MVEVDLHCSGETPGSYPKYSGLIHPLPCMEYYRPQPLSLPLQDEEMQIQAFLAFLSFPSHLKCISRLFDLIGITVVYGLVIPILFHNCFVLPLLFGTFTIAVSLHNFTVVLF